MSREVVLWNHESTSSTSDAILNWDLLPEYNPEECVLEVRTKASGSTSSPILRPRGQNVAKRRLVVSPTPLSAEIRKKTPNLQLSLLSHLASSFNINPRSIVTVEAVPKSAHVADYMVLYFKDQYISRDDMWRAACNLKGQCIYVGKRITFTGGIRADVREIWRAGKQKLSAYVSATTKPVFRSESARYLIFIQMSKEMWEFEEDGELFYNKAIDGFLPELFKKWKNINAHHLVSIVLFTRVSYTGAVGPFCLRRRTSQPDNDLFQLRMQAEKASHNDFYKIVVDNVSSHAWESTLTELKRELHGFARDVLHQKRKSKIDEVEEHPAGTITSAMEGNVLEAINLAAHQFNRDYIDRDLLRTGTSMLFVTAGTGIFEVEEKLLKLTVESLLGNGIGMDFVCLSRRPLHVVPLFKYRKPYSEDEKATYEYVRPHICEISYYGENRDNTDGSFQPRLKMHALQMSEHQEVDTKNVSIPLLSEHAVFLNQDFTQMTPDLSSRLDLYDEMCFASAKDVGKIKSTLLNAQPPSQSRGEEVIQLLGTSLPSSEKQNFLSLYEHSKNATASNDGADFSLYRASHVSNDSMTSLATRDSGGITAVSPLDPRTVSPSKARSTFSRFMHRLSEKPESSVVSKVQPKRNFEPPRPMMMTLKSKPSIATMSGAVTISSAMTQNHKTIVTTGFTVPRSDDDVTSDGKSGSAVAIPIKTREPAPPELNTSTSRKLLTSIDAGEARAQSVSETLRGSTRSRRLSAATARSKASLAVKYKPEKPDSLDASPWHVLINPSYPSKNTSSANIKAWRWAHVSDRARRSGDMNWESMCAPAALPLTTTALIDIDELKSAKYSENSYGIYIGHEDQPLSQQELLHEMIGQRLVQGFQIAQLSNSRPQVMRPVNSIHTLSSSQHSLNHGPLGEMGEVVYLTHAQMEVHCIKCDPSRDIIEVTFFVRKRETPKPIGYSSLIWQLAQDDGYDDVVVVFKPLPQNHSWNYVDQLICGTEKRFTDSVRFWRARFLLIPNDLRDKRNPPPIAGGHEHFTEEEIRVAGIHKICELIERSIYVSTKATRSPGKTSKTALDSAVSVAFTTLEPTAYVAHEQHHFALKFDDLGRSQERSKKLNTSNLSLYDYANEIQSNKGVIIKDRLWHWRWHESSWVGSDFVNWLLDRTELQTRDEACQLAQKLMNQGLFEHVQEKHGFLDGFYLYRLKPDYSTKTAKTWFGSRKVTPNPVPSRARATSSVSARTTGTNNTSAVNSPVLRSQKTKPFFELSRWLEVDIDPHKKSHRPEFVSLHYDSVYNPETCFHIRLEWISVTAKLVEETVQQWARIGEKYGLTLVEAPVDEAFAVTTSNPFRAPLYIELCLEPPPTRPDETDVVTSEEKEAWLAKVLKHWNFVLDQEAAHKFPHDIDVTYSWGRPAYRYTQYIHRSGMSLCQVTPTGFLWLTNRLYVSRAAGAPTLLSLPSPVRINSTFSASEPDNLRNSFREWCQDEAKVQHFFDQGLENEAIALVRDERLGRSRPTRKSSMDDRSSIRSTAPSQ